MKKLQIQHVMPRLKKILQQLASADTWRGKRRFILYSLALHLGFLIIFVISFDWTSTPESSSEKKVDVVKATVVDEARVLAEMDKLRQADARRQKKEDARSKKLENQARKAKQDRVREEKHLKELEKKKKAEQKKLKQEQAKLKEQQRKVEKEKQRAADLAEKQKQQAEQLKKLEQQRADEQKRLDSMETQRLIEQEAQRRREEQDKLRKDLLKEEQARVEAAKARKARAEINKGIEVIKQRVARNWLKPSNSSIGLSCEVLVNLIPGGDVVMVRIISSSGDPLFDKSVEIAVRKASPLPLPSDPAMFEQFRELKFIFTPGEQ